MSEENYADEVSLGHGPPRMPGRPAPPGKDKLDERDQEKVQDELQSVWFYRTMMVTLITFLLLNAYLPHDLVFKNLRKVYLVSQTMFFFLISRTVMSSREQRIAYRYVSFGITFLFVYFFHTHEYVGEED